MPTPGAERSSVLPNDENCARLLEHKVDAGFLLGEVGGEQGSFDFGGYDYRKKLDYISPSRYGPPEQKHRTNN